MKKLLALTAAVGTTFGLATACNGIDAAAMFVNLSSSIDIEANYLTIAPKEAALFADASAGFTEYSEKMFRTINNVKATKVLFDKVTEDFNFNDLGKTKTGEITIESDKFQTETEVTNLSDRDGYALMFKMSDDAREMSVYIALEKVEGFINATMYQYVDAQKDGTYEMEMYSSFTKSNFNQIYFNVDKWNVTSISKTNNETAFSAVTIGETTNTMYGGITNGEVGQIFDATTHKGFNKDGSENTNTGLDSKVVELLTNAKLGDTTYDELSDTDVKLHLATLIGNLA